MVLPFWVECKQLVMSSTALVRKLRKHVRTVHNYYYFTLYSVLVPHLMPRVLLRSRGEWQTLCQKGIDPSTSGYVAHECEDGAPYSILC